MFAVLHIADFPLYAVLRTEARHVPTHPAALFAGTSKKSVVLAANPAARQAGVELGMTAPQAVARCPALLIRAAQPAAEAEARAALLAIGFTLSPSLEDTAPGICTAGVQGLARREHAVQAAINELTRVGLPATAGIARTPLLALYGARSTSTVVAVTDETNFLAPLPLAAADPPPELAGVLAGWGIRTLGDLTALPRDEIIRRFGAEGLALWQRATGGAPRPLHPVAPARAFTAGMEFEQEIESLEPLLFILRRFLDRLSLELRASQHVAAALELTLRLEDETSYQRAFRLPEPTADVEILFRALHTHLESLTTAAAIVAVSLQLTPARPLVRQPGFFETGLRDPHAFAETLARVSVLVGADHLGTPQLEDTHRPDAVKLAVPPAVIPPPAAPPLPGCARDPGPVEGVHPPLGAPLRRFRPPLPARVEFTAGRATYLWTGHVHGEIVHQGPEWRSSGDWWQHDRRWSRTEWDIALADGGLYRLLLAGESYFLEGEYD